MKTFRQFNELFDKKSVADWELTRDLPTAVSYSSNIDGDKVGVNFYQDSPTSGSYALMFTTNGTVDITGGGNAFEIFATVNDVVKDFVKNRKPTRLYFSAKELSRKRLYTSFMKKLSKSLKMKATQTQAGADGMVFFNLRK
jgi:hypothetical protein